MQDVLVIGANRGLGLGFVEALLRRGCRVTATLRSPLHAGMLGKMAAEAPLELLQLDVADADSRARFHRDMASRAVDTVVHNAGIYGPRGLMPGDLPDEAWQEVLHVDTVAPLLVVQGLLPQLRDAAKHGKPAAIHFLTSRMGSIADNGSGGSYLYRSAKAGLNAAARSLAIDLADDGIRVQLLHPGWVRTGMGGDHAPLEVEESVAGMIERMAELEMDRSGRFVDWSGEEIPW
jgi:NAD(P)-dependent dehydrogenase (short-subunit alcohol dehydrogenase family)